jgi:antitoxin component of RelBE/YafQ-DinJ toxin-antitoxin module
MTSETKKQFKKKIRNLRLGIRISKVLNIFLNKNDSKKNISNLKGLSIKVETLMANLRNIEKGKKIEQKQDILKELDGLKGNYKKINNSIYKKILKKIRTNISNVFKNTVKLAGKLINTTQKVPTTLIEKNKKD